MLFYALSKKKKQAGEGYEPVVSVSTKVTKDPLEDLGVSIVVRDNGVGIPQKVVDKIYRLFFTTKPTGLGTGLKLS